MPHPLLLAWRAAPALLLIVTAPAAQAATVAVPWGDWVTASADGLATLLMPVLIAAITALAAMLPLPLRLLVTSTLAERLARNAADFALNAVAGAAKDRVLSIPVANAVIAAAIQRAVDVAPGWLLSAAGGRTGIGEKVFRLLHLDPGATVQNTLRPALETALSRGAAR